MASSTDVLDSLEDSRLPASKTGQQIFIKKTKEGDIGMSSEYNRGAWQRQPNASVPMGGALTPAFINRLMTRPHVTPGCGTGDKRRRFLEKTDWKSSDKKLMYIMRHVAPYHGTSHGKYN